MEEGIFLKNKRIKMTIYKTSQNFNYFNQKNKGMYFNQRFRRG